MGDRPEKIDVPPPAHDDVVKVAQEGFGKNAAAYDENRPGYKDMIIEKILEEILLLKEISLDSLKYEILELGAGTGKLTELLAPKIPSGYRYFATEPSASFLDRLKSKSLKVDTANISASKIPLPDNSVKTVLCAQSLHWFSNEESLKEIHRVLVPNGKLIAVWNLKKFEEGSWMMEFYNQRLEVMAHTESPPHCWVNTKEWKKSLDGTGLYSLARHESLPGINNQSNLNTFLSHLRTISCYNVLPEDECQTYLDSLKQAILQYPDVNPDNIIVPFTSEFYSFTAN